MINRIAKNLLFSGCIIAAAIGCARPDKKYAKTTEDRVEPSFVLCCRADNNLFQALAESGLRCPRYDKPTEAVTHAPTGGGLLILADGYPTNTTVIEPSLLDIAAAKQLRLYIEFPASLPGVEVGQPRGIKWERAVVTSGFFGHDLEKMRILSINGCQFTPPKVTNADLVLARVAGYDTAVFGLPKETFPVLFEHPRRNLLVATTKLSQFVTARYGPTEAWRSVWQGILHWLNPNAPIPRLVWQPTVRPAYGRDAKLPPDVEHQALLRGIEWYRRGGQLVDGSRVKEVTERLEDEARWVVPEPDEPTGDGYHGVLEGYCSLIDHLGRQTARYSQRDDCTGESAMAFAFAAALSHNPANSVVASNLADFIYFNSPLTKGPRGDPASPSFGLIGWRNIPPSINVYYGDGGARTMLGTMVTAALLKSHRWDEKLMRCLLANFRTTGKNGFRGNRLDEKVLQAHGWKYFFDRDITNFSPHYEGYLWACFLWGYQQTGYEPFRQRAETAIRMTMDAYPDQWRWVNSFQIQRARMLLPLAWLVRVKDTPEHRAWLKRVTVDMLALQDASGAIREEIGDLSLGGHKPPASNERYGTGETPLLQTNGDPVCDLLYTANFALLGLHEAAAATKDPFYAQAEDKLMKFICRIQVRSEEHPGLDGGWFRAFDYRKWDYWASNGDWGWGAWCMETGWSQSWITSVLAMRQMRTSLWDVTTKIRLKDQFTKLEPVMLPVR